MTTTKTTTPTTLAKGVDVTINEPRHAYNGMRGSVITIADGGSIVVKTVNGGVARFRPEHLTVDALPATSTDPVAPNADERRGSLSGGVLTNMWYKAGSKCTTCGEKHPYGALIWYVKAQPRGQKVFCPKTECVGEHDRDALTAAQAMRGVNDAKTDNAASARAVANELADRVDEIVKRAVNPGTIRTMVYELVDGIAPRKVEIVEPDGTSTTFEREHELFEDLFRLLSLGENVWLGGPAGSGKTTAAVRIAKSKGMPYHVVSPCSDEFQLLGFKDASGRYNDTPFYRWATSEEPSLLIVDEVDRFHPRAVIALNAALANGFAVFPTGHVEINPRNVCVATANTWGAGAGSSEYVAAAKQDGAFVDRFSARLDWGYDEVLERHLNAREGGDVDAFDAALKIRANIAAARIKLIWGPRSTIALARRVAGGFTLKDAIKVSALATLDEQQRSRVLSGIAGAK